jgi:hypothetical protein
MENIEAVLAAFSDFMWGPPLVVLLVGGWPVLYGALQVDAFPLHQA